jgi:CheY-like chemotaxis protein
MEVADFAVGEAVDGADGLAQAAAFHPDAILLDLMMPGVDGYEVCRRLETAPATRDLNRHAYAAGAAACITKPFRREALLAMVHTTLHGVARRGKSNAS